MLPEWINFWFSGVPVRCDRYVGVPSGNHLRQDRCKQAPQRDPAKHQELCSHEGGYPFTIRP
jgi:hypothetical protein